MDEWPLFLLAREETMRGINRDFHSLCEGDLAEHFFKLWTRGFIECSKDGFESILNPDLELARQHLRSWQEWGLAYRLTPTGGQVWEHYASADWSRFFSSYIGSDPKEWTLSAPSRVPIELSRKCHRIGPLPLKGTERWEALEPWRATYWKELPFGHRLTYQYETWNMADTITEDEMTAEEEFARYCGAWHKSFNEVCNEHFP